MFQALLLLAVASAPTSPQYRGESWVWWTPPAVVTQRDRLGRSVDQILKMGNKSWAEFAYKKREQSDDTKSRSLAFSVDGASIVWGACLKARNDRLLAHWPASRRQSIEHVRRHLFLFGMACIGLESTLAGGGTYANHWPMYMWSSEGQTIYALVTHQAAPKTPTAAVATLKARLDKYQKMTHAPNELLGERPANLAEIHKLDSIAQREFESIEGLTKPLDKVAGQQATAFEYAYLVEYLGIRGADGTP